MPEIRLAELERLATAQSPDLADSILAFLEQDDPEPKAPPPEGALTWDKLLATLRGARNEFPDAAERSGKLREAWHRFLTQTDPPVPPRFAVAELVVRLYEGGTDAGRAAVLDLALRAPLSFGLWAGLKRVYKLAEERLDAELFGALVWRFDTAYARPGRAQVSRGTLLYLRRRGWRFLRELGRNLPALYPQFAAETLRRYTDTPRLSETWIPGHVIAHELHRYDATNHLWGLDSLGEDVVAKRAFDEAWKVAPGPLMFLLESAQADLPARFAIQSLKRDFPQALRDVPASWLGRLAARKLESVHDFVAEVFQSNPEFAQAKLRALGLHETVLALLESPSEKARTYAIEYARAQAPDLGSDRLAALLADGDVADDSKAFALEVLQKRKPKDLGAALLGRLLNEDDVGEDAAEWAAKTLHEGFDRAEVPEPFLVDMIFGAWKQQEWVKEWFSQKYGEREVPVAFWKRVLDDPRTEDEDCDFPLEQLEGYPVADIGVGWILDHLDHDTYGSNVAEWLERAERVSAEELERIKGLVFRRSQRGVAMAVLRNAKAVKPSDLGLPWLLALARREDAELHEFARRYLLEHMKPADFAPGADGQGVARLFELALGKEPEPVRVFAQTYLRCHHPVIGPEQEESKALDLKPQVAREAYTVERLWPALLDGRADVRRFAVAVARADLRRWGAHTRVYELTDSEGKEVRNLAYEALMRAGDPTADEARTLTPEELDAAKVFELAQSRLRGTREVAMELIRRHYERLGSAERLGWLMQSADRTVRTMAVRMLWERHRPRSFPSTWKPRTPSSGGGRGGAAFGAAQLPGLPKAPAPVVPEPVEPEPVEAEPAAQSQDPLEKPLDQFGLPEETMDLLGDLGVETVGELADLSAEELEEEGLEEAAIAELKRLLQGLHLHLEGDEADEGEDSEGDAPDEDDSDDGDDEGDDEENSEDEPDDDEESDDDEPDEDDPEEDEDEEEGAVEEEPEADEEEDEEEGEEEEEEEEEEDSDDESIALLIEACKDPSRLDDALTALRDAGDRVELTARQGGAFAAAYAQLAGRRDFGSVCAIAAELPRLDLDEQSLQRVLAQAVPSAMLSGNQEIIELCLGMMPAEVTWDILAYNLACLYAQREDREQLLEHVRKAIALGKSKAQFLADSDFEPYLEDDDFLAALEAPEDDEEDGDEPEESEEDESDDDSEDPDAGDEEEEDDDVVVENGVVEVVPAAVASPVPTSAASAIPAYAGRFQDVEALRDFLRSMLFGLPPGRAMESKDDRQARLRIPANQAKRNVIEVVRDLALQDRDFAQLVVPVLSEFSGSLARGEWQACLAALVAIQAKHPDLDISTH